jgi:hypothetical protein
MNNNRTDLLTIVRCQTCVRSSDLTLQADRFWCAWCQDWATIQLNRVKDIEIDLTSELPQLASQQSAQIPLQPLRIPTGWHVDYNNGLFEIDPLPELFPDENPWWIFKEDMLQMHNDRFNRLLDLGWYPEGDLVAGRYGLVVYEGDFRGRLLYEFSTRDRLELVAEIERLLSEICQDKL